MALSRKHFVAVAAILAEHANEPVVTSLAFELAAFFRTENPNFDRDRFLAAVGVDN